MAKGFVGNIVESTMLNKNFRQVVYTAKHTQLVVMALKPGEEIGWEVHTVDQFFRVEKGQGKVVIDGNESAIGPGTGIIVPSGSKHNVINSGAETMQLYTLYSPPHHRDQVVHQTKEQAAADSEIFDGKTTE